MKSLFIQCKRIYASLKLNFLIAEWQDYARTHALHLKSWHLKSGTRDSQSILKKNKVCNVNLNILVLQQTMWDKRLKLNCQNISSQVFTFIWQCQNNVWYESEKIYGK